MLPTQRLVLRLLNVGEAGRSVRDVGVDRAACRRDAVDSTPGVPPPGPELINVEALLPGWVGDADMHLHEQRSDGRSRPCSGCVVDTVNI